MESVQITFLRYAGSKRRLLSYIKEYLQPPGLTPGKYIDPKDASLDGEPMETLKWIAYKKWDMQPKQLPLFGCPHCQETVATLPYDAEEDSCPSCGNHLFLTDMLGFHLEMAEDSAPQSLAMSYMGVHETLLLFTAIRHFWQERQESLAKCLFVKDGPLYLRAQYSKLVNPIREFLVHAKDSGHPVQQ